MRSKRKKRKREKEKESITRVRCEFSAIRIYRDGNGRVQYRSPETNRSLESHTVCITDVGVSFGRLRCVCVCVCVCVWLNYPQSNEMSALIFQASLVRRPTVDSMLITLIVSWHGLNIKISFSRWTEKRGRERNTASVVSSRQSHRDMLVDLY